MMDIFARHFGSWKRPGLHVLLHQPVGLKSVADQYPMNRSTKSRGAKCTEPASSVMGGQRPQEESDRRRTRGHGLGQGGAS